ncbi:MAG: glutamine--fructose-6-phosphate transaminase (isomerizing) [Candidatus Stygibacter australis]|nr:glutamine--fructose-6-phosphate transaminase (isomerizing) [Candidatus Stygibacter australis]MDP8322162.1 glutamine--fructose-6-phosphate transaminase (isomerizing) [Candidatus Stygibacter australis]
MCGIVGYIGKRNTIPIVMEGLKRLEYRGYDSAGLAIINRKLQLEVFKQKGKIVELERILPESGRTYSNIGIGHTRWATHGKPTAINAHPHICSQNKIALVHNGIIENYKILKNKLMDQGYTFESETDSEVLAKLIGFFYQKDNNLVIAVKTALKLAKGAYGIAVICSDDPKQIVAARKGSPLILGIGNDEFFVASDVNAVIIHTKKVIYLNDDEIVSITKDNFEITNLDNEIIEAKISEVDWDISAIEKGDYKHFMLKEIFEQPVSVENAFRGRLISKLSTVRLGGLNMTPAELRSIQKIQIIACGTSWHSGLIGKFVIESLARIPVEVEYASEFRYRNPIITPGTIVFVISQSGETADTLAALREAKARGVKVFGITNVVGSTIARETDGGVYIHAGTEIGVASTKAFTSQTTVLILLGVMLGRINHIEPAYGKRFINELRLIPEKIELILQSNDYIREIAKTIVDSSNALYLGRGIHFPVALEGALKLKEISYIHAEGYPAAEMKHGPIALIDKNMPVIAIALKDEIYEKIISNLQEVNARSGRIITIATQGDELVKDFSKDVIYIPETLDILQPLLSVIPLQMLAYHIADLRNLDIDQPRNLAKSVTVE